MHILMIVQCTTKLLHWYERMDVGNHLSLPKPFASGIIAELFKRLNICSYTEVQNQRASTICAEMVKLFCTYGIPYNVHPQFVQKWYCSVHMVFLTMFTLTGS